MLILVVGPISRKLCKLAKTYLLSRAVPCRAVGKNVFLVVSCADLEPYTFHFAGLFFLFDSFHILDLNFFFPADSILVRGATG